MFPVTNKNNILTLQTDVKYVYRCICVSVHRCADLHSNVWGFVKKFRILLASEDMEITGSFMYFFVHHVLYHWKFFFFLK
jgi:hypothetical protein